MEKNQRNNSHADASSEALSDREVREKLIARGVENLSDAELISILIQDGRIPALPTAERFLESFGGDLASLPSAGMQRLRVTGGLGIKRAAVVASAIELGRRCMAGQSAAPTVISSNDDVIAMFRDQMSRLGHEEFWVVYLSAANTVIDKARVGQGGVSGVSVDHKLIVKRAVELLSSSMILVHNHPSGIARPSDDDRQLTAKVAAAAALFDINVLDHLIITAGSSFSFRAAGLL